MSATITTPASAATHLRIEDLIVSFPGDGNTTQVLDNISLDVATGEFLCILGPSGCGKSTLLSTIAGFLRPTSGAVIIDGETVTGPDPRRIFVFQERGVFPWLTVEGNIGFGLFKASRQEREQRVAHYIKMVGLESFERAYPSQLSGGMKQRLEVARALAVNPDMLFLDEPFGALDSITRLTMRRELLQIWEAEKKTIIFVTHDIDEAVQLADRVVVMSARPARIQQIVTIDIPHPRDLSSPRYLELRDGIFEQIGLAHNIWRAPSDLRRWERIFWPLFAAALCLLLWHYAVVLSHTKVIPSPRDVAKGLAELLHKHVLWSDILSSLERVAIGFCGAVVIGVPLGLALGWYPVANQVINPVMQILRPISPIAWIPVAIIFFGIGDNAAIFLIFLGAFFPILVSCIDGVANVPLVYRRAGRNFGLSPARLLTSVVFPAALPNIIVGLRLAFGIAWLVVVAAEMIAVDSGLGYLVIDSRNSGKRYDLVVGAMLLIGLVGLILDIGFRRLETIKSIRWGFRDAA